ncbi:glycosyltransferase family 2 protein [Candidatus Bathyarchaeota archaeon]|nr:glycosyltransferase family 2 protein [Candidatus Bathyarchaeota archaeon]
MTFPNITVILPALNEEEGIGATIVDLKTVLPSFNLVVIDGGSQDITPNIASEMGGKLIAQLGHGKGDAVSQAIKNVEGTPEFIIFIDADFTYPAKYLKDMINILKINPEVGMVLGNRFDMFIKPKGMGNPYYTGNRLLAIAQYILNGVKLNDPLTGLRVIRWDILKDWKPKSKGFDIEVEMNHFVERCGLKIVEIPISYRARLGKKKLGLSHGFSILRRILLESNFFPEGFSKKDSN